MERAIKNFSLNLLYQILVAVIPIVFLPIISRRLGAESVGLYSYIASYASLFSIIGLLGLNTYSAREIAYNNVTFNSVRKCFQQLYAIRLYLLVIVTTLYFFVTRCSEHRVLFSIYFIEIFSAFLDISWLFIGIEQLKTVVFRNLFVKIFHFIAVMLFINSPSDLALYIFISVFSTMTGIIVMYPSAIRFLKGFTIWISFQDVRKHIKSSIKLFLPQMASQLYVQCNKVMMMWLSSAIQLGYYEQCEKIAKMPVAITSALATVMMPRIANEYMSIGAKDLKKYLKLGIIVLDFIMIPITFGLAAISDSFIKLYLGGEFEAATPIFSVVLFCIIPISLSSITGSQFLVAFNQTKALTISYSLAAASNIALNYFLIPKYGGIGAALSTVVTESIVAGIQLFFLQKYLKTGRELVHIMKSILIALVMFIVLRVLGESFNGGDLLKTCLIEGIIGVVIYYGIYSILNIKIIIDGLATINVKIKKKNLT